MTKPSFFSLLLLCSAILVSGPSFAKSKKKDPVNPYGKFFSDAEGLAQVEMAVLTEKNKKGLNDVILKITGFAADQEGIDGKTIKYKAVPGPSKGFDLVYGDGKTRLSSRMAWGSWKQVTLYVGGMSLEVYEQPSKAKSVNALHLYHELDRKPAKAGKPSELNKYGLAFRGIQSDIKVEMATFQKKNDKGLRDVLIKVSGAEAYDAGIDGQVIRYTAAHGSRDGVIYQFKNEDGETRQRMQRSKTYGSNSWELYLGKKNIRVVPDPDAAKKVRPLHLLTDSKKKKKK